MVDVIFIVLAILSLVAMLILCALLLYCLCWVTAKSPEEEEKEELRDNPVTAKLAATTQTKTKATLATAEASTKSALKEGRNKLLAPFATGRQTMSSTLQRSATDSDVILATATSAIPLKELGGRNNDVLIDISQQLLFNKEDEAFKEEQSCIVCRTRKEITWSQVSCYAQTIIGVLVYKRAPATIQSAATASPSPPPAGNIESIKSIKSKTSPPKQQQPQQKQLVAQPPPPTLSTSKSEILGNYITDRAKTVSTTTLAPEPDSRLDLTITKRPKQQQQLSRTSPRSPVRSPQTTTTLKGLQQQQQQQQQNRSPSSRQQQQQPQAQKSPTK